uniref:Uncharacterized protein n=1 Tax=Myotis lucifugus TaxID=59463 RepID=G1Q606_MYOLU
LLHLTPIVLGSALMISPLQKLCEGRKKEQ